MHIKIYQPFSGWLIADPGDAKLHGYTVEVDAETATRWTRVLDEYRRVQAEMQAAAYKAEPHDRRGH